MRRGPDIKLDSERKICQQNVNLEKSRKEGKACSGWFARNADFGKCTATRIECDVNFTGSSGNAFKQLKNLICSVVDYKFIFSTYFLEDLKVLRNVDWLNMCENSWESWGGEEEKE